MSSTFFALVQALEQGSEFLLRFKILFQRSCQFLIVSLRKKKEQLYYYLQSHASFLIDIMYIFSILQLVYNSSAVLGVLGLYPTTWAVLWCCDSSMRLCTCQSCTPVLKKFLCWLHVTYNVALSNLLFLFVFWVHTC